MERCNACLPYLNDILSRVKKEPDVTRIQLDRLRITLSIIPCRTVMDCATDAVLATNEKVNGELQSRYGKM